MSKVDKQKENSLVIVIQNDPQLDRETKMEYLTMANLFYSDFKENLTRNSIELQETYDIDADSWRKFLLHPGIKRIVDSFINEQIKKKTDKALIDGEADASSVKVRQIIEEADTGEDNSKFIIMRLPDKVEDLNER